MPFVDTIVIDFVEAPNNTLECLEALKLSSFKKRKLKLHVCSYAIESNVGLINFLKTIHWHYVASSVNVALDLTTQCAHLGSYTWASSIIRGLKKLIILDMMKNDEISVVCTKKAFDVEGLEALQLWGLLTDDAMIDLKTNWTIRVLDLHYQGVCNWHNAQDLQRACPNLESFSIVSSNLLKSHLDLFCWPLWPSLRSLNLEHNYTLQSNTCIQWPRGLQELFVAFTNINGPHSMPFGLTKVSCNLELTDAWFQYLRANNLTSISASMKHHIKNSDAESAFWSSFEGLQRLSIHHLEFFKQESLLSNIRSKMKKILVIKRKPTDWPCELVL